MGICLGELNIGCLIEVVVWKVWLYTLSIFLAASPGIICQSIYVLTFVSISLKLFFHIFLPFEKFIVSVTKKNILNEQ